MLDHVVEDLLGREQQAPVEAHRAVRGAAGPTGRLGADRQRTVGGSRSGASLVEAPGHLLARTGAVPALERVADRLRPWRGHRNPQDLAALRDVRALPPAL